MDYNQLRKELIQYINDLQAKGFSYQSFCDYINSQQDGFVLFKDFFSRFQSKPTYFRSGAKQEKLALIHQHLQRFYHQNMDAADTMSELFKKAISNVAAAKFEAFLGSSRSGLANALRLSEFYFENSPAYLSIVKELRHRKQYEWELDVLNYGSTFKILSVKADNLFHQNAVVTTEEYWKLCWVNTHSKELQFKFESLGQQTYLLARDEQGRWKVIENMMKAPPNKIAPEYIDFEMLEQLSSDSWEENRRIASRFLSANEILHCIEFVRAAFSGNLPENQTYILARIKKSYLNSHRLLNTNVINFAAYQSEMESLSKQLKLICDSIFLSNK